MTLANLTPTTRRQLRSRGYSDLTFTEGWDETQVPLYTHKKLNDKVPGDIAFRAHVNNPRSLSPAEANYLARKGDQGFFTWPPDACMDKEFTTVTVKPRPGGGFIEERSQSVFGCRWCRAAQPTGLLEGQDETFAASLAESAVKTPQPPAPPSVTTDVSGGDTLTVSEPTGVKCPECSMEMKAFSHSGKPRSNKQQLHALKMHISKAHSG